MPTGFLHTHLKLKKAALFTIIHALIPFLALTGFMYINQRNLAIRSAQKETNYILDVASRTYSEKIKDARSILYTLATFPEAIPSQASACSKVFANLLKQFDSYANFGVTDDKGQIYCSGIPITQKIDASDRFWYTEAVKNKSFSVGVYQIGRITHKPSVNFGYPIMTGDKITGVVFAALDLQWIKNVTDNFKLPEGSTVTVIDRDGTILARFPEEGFVGTNQKDAPIVKKVLENGPAGNFVEKGLDGEERYYFYSKVEESGGNGDFFLYIGITKSKLFEGANQQFRINFLVFVSVIFLSLLIAYADWKLFLEKEPVSS